MPRVLVIGASGTVGRQVAAQLAAAGIQVRALSRRQEPLPNVEAFRGDLAIPETLDAALDGADAVFLVWTAPVSAAAAAIERVAKYARRIVFLSAPLKTPHPFFQQPNPVRRVAMEIERLIESSDVPFTILRPGIFAANAIGWWAHQIRAGDVVRWPYLDTPTAPIDERDIAAIAVRALCEDGHTGAEYVLTGPESLTQCEQISTIGSVIGRPLRIQEASPEEARRELLYAPGFTPGVVNMLLDAWAAAQGRPAFVSATFAKLAGIPPRTFRQWAADHAAEFTAGASDHRRPASIEKGAS